MFNVENKIIVITGVCGQMGGVYAKFFLKNGAIVIGLDISSHKKLDLDNKNFFFVETDITNKKSIIKALEEIKQKFGIPEVLINNAGLDSPPETNSPETGRFEEYPEEAWDRVLDVNLKGIFLTSQIFGEAMCQNKKGSIINVSSIYGLVSPDPKIYDYKNNGMNSFYKPVAYSASKSGIIGFSKSIALELGSRNIRCNVIAPGFIVTEMTDKLSGSVTEDWINNIPLKRSGSPVDVANVCIFLASDLSSYITGQVINVDGGLLT